MRLWLTLPLLAIIPALPLSQAAAGFALSASLGKGIELGPDTGQASQLNLMLTPGYSVLDDALRFELGIVGEIPDLKRSEFDLSLRPMLRLEPPILPIYGRLIFGVTKMAQGDPVQITFGGAAGIDFSAGPVGIFAELGMLPTVDREHADPVLRWLLELRAGVQLVF